MSFLFTTVLVLLLVAPGLLIFRTYYAGRFSIRYSNLTITDQVFRSIVPGLLLQLIAFWLIGICSSRYVRLDVLGSLLLGAKEDRTIREGFDLLRQQLGPILAYYLGLLTAGALAGWGARWLVRWLKLDRRYSWLRYDNQWHYLLTGEILETPDLQPTIGLQDASLIDFVFVDVLMKLEKSNMLYSGILVDYELAADGGLRTIYLREVRRKLLSNGAAEEQKPPVNTVEGLGGLVTSSEAATPTDEQAEGKYYDVLGDLMVIPYAQTLNLNLTYYIEEDDLKESKASMPSSTQEYTVTTSPSDMNEAVADDSKST
ncbi:MAG: hypothetical protein M3Y54_10005 [Bacteroidota bacterium]|nr:hypothetical protein [Bacteroidota bacterium]